MRPLRTTSSPALWRTPCAVVTALVISSGAISAAAAQTEDEDALETASAPASDSSTASVPGAASTPSSTSPSASSSTSPAAPATPPQDRAAITGQDSQQWVNLLNDQSTWKYLDDGTDPANGLPKRTDWTQPAFNDSSWSTGKESFGALKGTAGPLSGGVTPATVLKQYRDNGVNKEAFFFRTTFTVSEADLQANDMVQGILSYDDAATIYLNGQRITGFHDTGIAFPEEGANRNLQFGGSNQGSPLATEFRFPSSQLKAGENTLAVELHQGSKSSSDVYFALHDLSLGKGVPDEVDLPTTDQAGKNRKNIVLGVGATESERRLAWFSATGKPETVELAAGEHSTMPGDAAVITPDVRAASADAGFDYIHARLTGLRPGVYSYRVGSDESGWSDILQFRVYPSDLNHHFTFMGDPQIGASGDLQKDSEGWQRVLDKKDELFPESQFTSSAGDQINSYTGKPEEYSGYIDPKQMRTQASAQTLGNHDYSRTTQQPLFNQHFYRPNVVAEDVTNGSYYFFHNGVLHLNVSTENTDFQAVGNFLKTAVEANRDKAEWIVLTMHRGFYTAGPHSTGATAEAMREQLLPLIDTLPIDLVLNGHDHSYARSYVMQEGKRVEGDDVYSQLPDGTKELRAHGNQKLFITANSASGSKYYDLKKPEEVPWADFVWQNYQQTLMDVEVQKCSITANTVLLSGASVDKVRLKRPDSSVMVKVSDDNLVKVGEQFDPRQGLSVQDDCGVAKPEDVAISGTVDTKTKGTYPVTYRITGRGGAVSEVTRNIVVTDAETSAPATSESSAQPTTETSASSSASTTAPSPSETATEPTPTSQSASTSAESSTAESSTASSSTEPTSSMTSSAEPTAPSTPSTSATTPSATGTSTPGTSTPETSTPGTSEPTTSAPATSTAASPTSTTATTAAPTTAPTTAAPTTAPTTAPGTDSGSSAGGLGSKIRDFFTGIFRFVVNPFVSVLEGIFKGFRSWFS